MAEFDISYTTFYHFAIVVPFSNYLTLKNIVTVKCSFVVTRSLEIAPFNRSHSSSVVTMAISCIVPEIKRDIGRKSQFFISPIYTTTLLVTTLL